MRIKGWGKFQHFKDRKPIWIKLYRDLMDDLEWFTLDGDSAKCLVMLWLIASEMDGELPDIKTISFRLRSTIKETTKLIGNLSHWIEVDDSENADNLTKTAVYQDDIKTISKMQAF